VTTYLTPKMAGEKYPAIGTRHFRRLMEEGKLAYSKVGGKVIINEDDILALIDAGRHEARKGLRPSDVRAAVAAAHHLERAG
jgi:hypothetical protein